MDALALADRDLQIEAISSELLGQRYETSIRRGGVGSWTTVLTEVIAGSSIVYLPIAVGRFFVRLATGASPKPRV